MLGGATLTQQIMSCHPFPHLELIKSPKKKMQGWKEEGQVWAETGRRELAGRDQVKGIFKSSYKETQFTGQYPFLCVCLKLVFLPRAAVFHLEAKYSLECSKLKFSVAHFANAFPSLSESVIFKPFPSGLQCYQLHSRPLKQMSKTTDAGAGTFLPHSLVVTF